MDAKELLAKVQDWKEQAILNGFVKPNDMKEFFDKNWLRILDILDDALCAYLNGGTV